MDIELDSTDTKEFLHSPFPHAELIIAEQRPDTLSQAPNSISQNSGCELS